MLKVTFSGDREAMANLRRVAAVVGDDAMRGIAVEALQPVADTAKSLVPVRSGITQDGIVVSDRLPGGEDEFNGKAAYVGVLDGGSFWAGFVELGTVHMRAEPFLLPAVDAEEGRVFQIFGERAGQLLLSAT